jgi:hypothetical protein
MKPIAADKYIEILQRCWDENKAFWDRDAALSLLGSEDSVGYLLAWVLASDLRGWHFIAAKELRKSIIRHAAPPQSWLEQLWNYAHASITSDPDEMQHLFGLMHMAKADSVRQWFAEPLVSLCGRQTDSYAWLGFEGVECLVQAGGLTHLRRFIPQLILLAKSAETPVYREAAARTLELVGTQIQPEGILSAERIRDFVLQIGKPLSIRCKIGQGLSEFNYHQSRNPNDYTTQNRISKYATN